MELLKDLVVFAVYFTIFLVAAVFAWVIVAAVKRTAGRRVRTGKPIR